MKKKKLTIVLSKLLFFICHIFKENARPFLTYLFKQMMHEYESKMKTIKNLQSVILNCINGQALILHLNLIVKYGGQLIFFIYGV